MEHHEITVPVSRKTEHINIFSICCLHIGARAHDREKALDYRNYILNTPDTYAFDLGDDIENAIPGDELHNSMTYDSNMSPAEQVEEAVKFWTPLVEEGKLLLTHDSNHFWRSEAKTGISVAKNLNIFLNQRAKKSRGPAWGRWQSFTKLHVGKNLYRIHSWHGAGGSATPEGALKKCRSQAMIHQADVYLMGHYHRRIVDTDVYFTWPDGAEGPMEAHRYYGVTGSFMKWHGTYAERAGYAPALRGAIKVELSARRWDVRISG